MGATEPKPRNVAETLPSAPCQAGTPLQPEVVASLPRALLPPHPTPRMTSTLEPQIELPALAGGDALFQLQLQVAIRADELARASPDRRRPAWLAWIQAEREVLTALADAGGLAAAVGAAQG